MTTGKTIALTIQTLVSKVISLLLNMLSRLVITFLPRSKRLLISWLQSPSAVILEPPKNKVWHCFHCFPIYFPWSDGTGCHDLRFLNVAQNSPNQASTVLEPWTSRCSSRILKGQKNRGQIANIRWIIKKAREFQKNIYFCCIDYAKAFDCEPKQTLENSSTDGNTRPPDLPPEKSVCRSRSNS